MVKMTVKIDLVETKEGHVRSRVATGFDTQPGSELPTWAIIDHMLRKVEECFPEAKALLTKQAKMQLQIKGE